MKLFGFPLKPRRATPAQTAKERLQILLAHERSDGTSPDCLPALQHDILEAVRRHLKIDRDAVDIRMDRGDDYSTLEINIEFPRASRRP